MPALATTVFGVRPLVSLKSSVQLEKQSDGSFKIIDDDAAPTITIDELDASTITAEDYGGYVTNYASENSAAQQSVGWRIFHSDGENIYLIADNYIENKYKPAGKNNTTYTLTSGIYGADLNAFNDYAGSPDITESYPAKKWLSQYTYENTKINMRATAYLMDTNAWNTGFANNYAEYAIGGPTIELFVASYNQTHEKDIEIQTDAIGYDVRWTGETFGNHYISGLNVNEDLYLISDTFENTVKGMWLASPSGATYSGAMSLHADGYVDDDFWWVETNGMRPLVSLKSDAKLVKLEDGTYLISPTEEEINSNKIWSKTKEVEVKIIDNHSGLAEGTTVKYGWSISAVTEPTNWKNVTISGYTAGANSVTFTAQATAADALSGEYYLWVKAITIADTEGNTIEENTTIVSTNTYLLDNAAPTIAIDQLTASTITAEDYGGYVTNYASSDSAAQQSVGWRIFHSDGENIYLIADNYIENTYKPAGKSGTNYSYTSGTYGADLTALKDYAGSSDITASHPAKKWLSKYTYESTNENMKATAYLMDTSVWNTGFANSRYAEYAIGGPTLELFTASYNATHEKDIEIQAEATGYDVKWPEGSWGNYYIIGLDTNEDLYVISNSYNGLRNVVGFAFCLFL